MNFLTPAVLVLVPIVIGLVEVVKRIGLNTKYLPLVAVILGVAGVLGLEGINVTSVMGGIVVGLSAVGLFSGTRATIQ